MFMPVLQLMLSIPSNNFWAVLSESMSQPHKNSSGLLTFWTLKYPKYPLLVIKCHSTETSKCPLIPSAIVSSLGPSEMPKNPATKMLIPGSKSESFRTLLNLFWLICVLPCLLLNILNITPNAEFHIAFPPPTPFITLTFSIGCTQGPISYPRLLLAIGEDQI